ncbi:MAG: histidine--tRNA ligase [Candidatus Vogelbacteria bacterium]|nr:histidine--tRNA ligase [Candidatus Vogelbacteria bacterium]
MAQKKENTKLEPPKAPKGMRDLMAKEYYYYQGFFEKAAEVATYFGFKPIEVPLVEETRLYTSGIGVGTDIVEKEMYEIKTGSGSTPLAIRPELTAGIVRAYMENGMQTMPQPVMLYSYGTCYRHEKPQKGRYREFRQFGLEILGSDKSITDATVIKVTVAALEEAGHKNLQLSINSIGDKSCRNGYKKELTNYYKKHLSTICKDCKVRLKNNPLRLLDCKDEKCHPIKEGAPQSVGFLCDPCKQHFKEVLEYLEALKIEYTIDSNLVRGIDYYTRTVFEISARVPQSEEKGEPEVKVSEENKTEVTAVEPPPEQPALLALAGGGRYDYLAKTLGYKKDLPAVGVGIGVDRVISTKGFNEELAPRILKKPKIFFIQLGFSAKLQSLAIIEILRKAKIPVMQSLSKDSLSSQLGTAEKMKIPYTIILGQKEVIDGTVIVRNMDTRSQEEIKVEKLTEYVKKIK